MHPSTHDLDRSVASLKSRPGVRRTWVSPYKAMKAIAQGAPPSPAASEIHVALEKRLRAIERHEFMRRLVHALAWFGSLLVIEGD